MLLIRIIDYLKLRRPVYCPTAAYGHFGRKELAWEQVDGTEELKAKARHGNTNSCRNGSGTMHEGGAT